MACTVAPMHTTEQGKTYQAEITMSSDFDTVSATAVWRDESQVRVVRVETANHGQFVRRLDRHLKDYRILREGGYSLTADGTALVANGWVLR